MNDEFIIQKLDKIIELLAHNNALMLIACGIKDEDELIECPKCKNKIVPNGLGYCPQCRFDLKGIGLIEDKPELGR